MPVIRPEMINNEITRKDLLPLSFLKKSAYTGSKRKMNYKLAKTEVPVEMPAASGDSIAGATAEGSAAAEAAPAPEPEMRTVLRVYVWPGPFAYDVTDPEKIVHEDMEFSNDGIDDAIEWLNEQLHMMEAGE